MSRLPTFLIIGANKAGTTSLYHYVGEHPQVFMSRVKEPHFFTYMGHIPGGAVNDEATRLLPPEAGELRTLDEYASLFAGAGPQHLALGEASTGYLCGLNVPGRVREHLPDVRLVAILRDPAERAWSEYLMMRRQRQEPDPSLIHIIATRTANRYVDLGRYGSALDRWLAAFPAEAIRIHLFEDFVARTDEIVADVLGFIGVDPDIVVDTSRRHNARARREPRLDPATRAALIEVLEPEISRTEEIVGRDLSEWRHVPSRQTGIRRWLRGGQVASRS
jgi:Sulfotransferase family